MSCIDKEDFVGTLFLYLRKAFDVVDHTILIEKLTAYKLIKSLQWFKSYLNGRRQAVPNGKGLSEFITTNAGIPVYLDPWTACTQGQAYCDWLTPREQAVLVYLAPHPGYLHPGEQAVQAGLS